MSSAKETQEPSSTHFWHCLEPKTVFHISVIFLIIWGVLPTSCQTCESSEIRIKYFQKMLQIISLLFSVVNIEEWALIQPDNLLPQIDGFNCGIHAILNTYYLLFPNTDKDNVASDYCYEDLAAARYWLAYKLKNLKAFEHKRKKIVTLLRI